MHYDRFFGGIPKNGRKQHPSTSIQLTKLEGCEAKSHQAAIYCGYEHESNFSLLQTLFDSLFTLKNTWNYEINSGIHHHPLFYTRICAGVVLKTKIESSTHQQSASFLLFCQFFFCISVLVLVSIVTLSTKVRR